MGEKSISVRQERAAKGAPVLEHEMDVRDNTVTGSGALLWLESSSLRQVDLFFSSSTVSENRVKTPRPNKQTKALAFRFLPRNQDQI
jgi:hypothetical protein